jgi:hypothetical protein
MERSFDGSFTVQDIASLLHVSNVTANKISQIPELERTMIMNQYRIRKRAFWKWYDSQSFYTVFETPFNKDDYFSASDVAEMLKMKTSSASQLLKKHSLRADISELRVYVLKEDFIDWYIHQMRYSSKDPRLPPKEVSPTYDIHQIKKKLDYKSNQSVYNLYKKGLFDVVRVGGQTRVDKASFDKWFASMRRQSAKRGKKAWHR